MDYRSVGVRSRCTRVWRRASVMRSGRHWGYPTRTVDVVVVGAYIVCYVYGTGEVVVGGHGPDDSGNMCVATESEVLCSVVETATISVAQPYASQVERHVDLFSRVGVVAENPQLVVFAGDPLGPDVGDDDVSLNLVVVATVNHHFILCVEKLDTSVRL